MIVILDATEMSARKEASFLVDGIAQSEVSSSICPLAMENSTTNPSSTRLTLLTDVLLLLADGEVMCCWRRARKGREERKRLREMKKWWRKNRTLFCVKGNKLLRMAKGGNNWE